MTLTEALHLEAEEAPALDPHEGLGHLTLDVGTDLIPTLAVGADLDGAFSVASGRRFRLSRGFEDLRSGARMRAYLAELSRFEGQLEIEFEQVAHDLDPGLVTTRLARSLGLPTVEVQHHHAHVAAVMAEHHVEGKLIGVVLDGPALGSDGATWGGEFLLCDGPAFSRGGRFRPVPRLGSGAAAIDAVRMAASHAADAGVLSQALRLMHLSMARSRDLQEEVGRPSSAGTTSSAEELFDALGALTGFAHGSRVQGQSAARLGEGAATSATFEYPFDISVEDGLLVLDTRPVIAAVVRDLVKGRHNADVAGRFHRTMAAGILAACRLLRGQTGLDRVVLAGSVLANDLLLSDLAARLGSVGFTVFRARKLPPGDGGLALGQAFVAAVPAPARP